MRKNLLGILLLVAGFAFIAAPVNAANTWEEFLNPDDVGIGGADYKVDGTVVEGTQDSVAGYAEDGNAFHSYAPISGSRVFGDTDVPLSVPTYSIPCPADQLEMNCSYVARDPQTDDWGVANTENEGIILDDLFTWVEDFTDQTTDTQRHIAQALDILFYNNSSHGGLAPDNQSYPVGLGISQTLDQDLADFEGTVGGNGNGIAGVIWQNFNLVKLGPNLHVEDGDDIWESDGGWIDQVIYAYVGDIEGGTGSGSNGSQGIKQSYLSKKVVVGDGGSVCNVLFPNCTITEQQGHADLDLNGELKNVNHVDKTVSHVTKPTMSDP